MARGTVNKVFIMGRLGQDPEVRHTNAGITVATVSVATNDGYKDSNTGQFVDQTEWHRVVVFGKQAEMIQQYVKKGSQLHIEGRLRTNKWQDSSGQDRYTTEIVANQVQMVGGSSHSDNAPLPNYVPAEIAMPSSTPIQDQKSNAKDSDGKSSNVSAGNLPDVGGYTDDIPF